MRPDSLAVIGLGAIGGSLAWQCRRFGVTSVIGYSPERAEAVQALRAGALTDIAETPERAVQDVDLVVLAAPPDAILHLLESILPCLAPRTLLTDVASVKLPVVLKARTLGIAERYAGSHPFAGTHRSGWAAARADLFRQAIVYVCSTGPQGDPAARQIMNFWESVLEAHPVLIDAETHDRQLAWTSHLPQAVASALAYTLGNSELNSLSLGSGARDTTRLAAGNPELWAEVLLLNRDEVVDALVRAGEDLERLASLLASGDRAGVRGFLERGARFRRGLESGAPD